MLIVTFIADYQTSRSTRKHIGEETIRSPPLRVHIPTTNIPDTAFWEMQLPPAPGRMDRCHARHGTPWPPAEGYTTPPQG